jgi:hypothetical protein
MLAKPMLNKIDRKMQEQLGIFYDYSKVEFEGNQPKSFSMPPVFKEFYDLYYKNREELNNLRTEYEELKKRLTTDELRNDRELRKVEIEKMLKMEDIIKEKENKYYYEEAIETLKNNYVNEKLKELGYEPRSIDNRYNNYSWKLKYGYDKEDDDKMIKPADYKSPGRLFIVKPKRDLKIYDTTEGGKREADLTDEDYHKHSWFRIAEEKGYDGIRIADHCQSGEDRENIGHLSIGIFRNIIKDLEIISVPAIHHELGQFFGTDWETPEYKAYKSKK